MSTSESRFSCIWLKSDQTAGLCSCAEGIGQAIPSKKKLDKQSEDKHDAEPITRNKNYFKKEA